MALRAVEIEALLTVNDQDVARAERNVKASGDRIEKKPITQKVTGDEKDAVESIGRVATEAKKLVSARTVATVDANIDRATKGLDRAQARLDYLRSVETDLDVSADIGRAEANLSKLQRQRDALVNARAKLEVDADTVQAESALDDVAGKAGEAGEKGGRDAGSNLADGIVAALVSIPIAGAVIGVGKAAGDALFQAINDGLQVEARGDRLQALTGLSPEQAGRIGRAAGEAYANVFGESIESNMDTARLAVQFDIIDPDSTTRDAKAVVEGLAGIADVLGEDVRPVATAVTTLLRTGVAKSAQDAFDLIAAGERNGANRAEDLLDTLTEYPALFARLGLSGPQALGLINQGLSAGARNSDLAADALKEFQIRATDASTTSADGFKALGIDAADMTARIAAGGKSARDGLQEVLDKLRETEDPVTRNAAAVALFGTQAEDLGAALFTMDLSSAVEELDGVTGSAQRMFDTLAGNDATKIEQAQRNIEVAADGIKGALAAAFSEPIGDFADFVSRNRGPVLQFFVDLANGALDFAETASDGVGAFVSGPLAEMIEGIAGVIDVFNGQEGRPKELDDLAAGMREFTDTTDVVSDKISEARDRLNEFAEPQIALAVLNDRTLALAEAMDTVGLSAENGTALLDQYSTAKDGSARASGELRDQLVAAVDAMNAEIDAAAAAKESQANLNDRWTKGRDALIGQLEAMGLTRDEAIALAEAYGAVPADVATSVVLRGADAAEEAVDKIARDRVASIRINLTEGGRAGSIGNNAFTAQAKGSVLEFMRDGGLRGLTPMQPLAQMVPASTWRVVGDRSDVPELYAPLDGSARSWALLLEGFRRMPGVMPMADGGVVTSSPAPGGGRGDIQLSPTFHLPAGISHAEALSIFREMVREVLGSALG